MNMTVTEFSHADLIRTRAGREYRNIKVYQHKTGSRGEVDLPISDGRLYRAIADFIKYARPLLVKNWNGDMPVFTRKGGGPLGSLNESVQLLKNSLKFSTEREKQLLETLKPTDFRHGMASWAERTGNPEIFATIAQSMNHSQEVHQAKYVHSAGYTKVKLVLSFSMLMCRPSFLD